MPLSGEYAEFKDNAAMKVIRLSINAFLKKVHLKPKPPPAPFQVRLVLRPLASKNRLFKVFNNLIIFHFL